MTTNYVSPCQDSFNLVSQHPYYSTGFAYCQGVLQVKFTMQGRRSRNLLPSWNNYSISEILSKVKHYFQSILYTICAGARPETLMAQGFRDCNYLSSSSSSAIFSIFLCCLTHSAKICASIVTSASPVCSSSKVVSSVKYCQIISAVLRTCGVG